MVKHGEVHEKMENKFSYAKRPNICNCGWPWANGRLIQIQKYKYKIVLATFLFLVVCVALKIKKALLSFMGKAKYAIDVF